MSTLFDSNILIDALKGIAPALEEIASEERPTVSIVTQIEVLAGSPTYHVESVARDLLSRMTVLPLSSAVAEATVTVRRTTRLKLPDAIILATARVHGLTLLTRNTRDFPRDDPSVRVPYEL